MPQRKAERAALLERLQAEAGTGQGQEAAAAADDDGGGSPRADIAVLQARDWAAASVRFFPRFLMLAVWFDTLTRRTCDRISSW